MKAMSMSQKYWFMIRIYIRMIPSNVPVAAGTGVQDGMMGTKRWTMASQVRSFVLMHSGIQRRQEGMIGVGRMQTREEGPVDRKQALNLREAVERGRRGRWWRRRGSKGRGFWYVDAQGARIGDEAHIERIRSLAIPPAWKEVRINPAIGGRLQAVGVDTSGRIQYRYHPGFAATRQRQKYARIE